MIEASAQPALVLHRRPYREGSLLVEALTRDAGRVGLVARGVHRRRTPLAGLLQPLQPLLISWRGRGDLVTLHQAEPAGPPLRVQGEALYAALYLNELLMRLLQRHLALGGLYRDYLETLLALEHGLPIDWWLRRFECRLLETLGYAIDWRHAIDGTPLHREQTYRLQGGEGLVPVSADAEGFCILGATLSALLDDGPLPEAYERTRLRRLLAALLAPHLGPRPLASRELLRRARGSAATRAGAPNPSTTKQ